MRHGGMVSRGRWDMRWWWFSLTDILIHIIHLIHTYIRAHTLVRGRYPSCTDTLSFFCFFFFNIHIHMLIYTYMHINTHIYTYIYIHTHTYIYIYTHTYVNIHIPVTMHTQVRGRYPSCTVYILPSIPGWGGDTPAAPSAHFFWTLHTQVRGRYPSCTLTCISIPALRQGEWVGLFALFI